MLQWKYFDGGLLLHHKHKERIAEWDGSPPLFPQSEDTTITGIQHQILLTLFSNPTKKRGQCQVSVKLDDHNPTNPE